MSDEPKAAPQAGEDKHTPSSQEDPAPGPAVAAPAAPDEPKLQPHDEGCPALGTEERQHCDCGRYERYEHKLELYGECLRRNLSAAEGRMAELTRELAKSDKEITDSYDAIFPFVPEAASLPVKIYTLAARADAAESRLAAVEEALTEVLEFCIDSRVDVPGELRARIDAALRSGRSD